MQQPARPPIWFHSDRFLARNLARPLQRFLHIEASGGVLLLASTVIALGWANSPWSAAYERLWSTEISLDVGGRLVSEDLRHWLNDGLMALFFFVVGLEIKQELVTGHLSKARDAALPAIAALGGMALPAVLYVALNGGEGRAGWGVPLATDIAFAVGVLALFGSRVPAPLKVLLLALAIVDDICAIAVIALFYSEGIHLGWAAAAALGTGAIVVLTRLRVWYVPLYAVAGAAVWFATLESGIHATIAGALLGLLTPARPLLEENQATAIADELSDDRDVTVAEVRAISFRLRESVSVAERLQNLLHPWTSYVVIPLFALANAGIAFSREGIAGAATSAVTVGVVVGLVVGKSVGITAAVLVATRLRVARLPAGITMGQVAAVAILAGIGYTVSLFIAGLAFDDPALAEQAKVGILVASALAAVIGSVALHHVLPRTAAPDGEELSLARANGSDPED